MATHKCGQMGFGCPKSPNSFHKCKKTITLSKSQENKIYLGGRIDGPVITDYCRGHVCQFCNKKFIPQ